MATQRWLHIRRCAWIGLAPDVAGEKSDEYYERANELDPNGYFTTANTGRALRSNAGFCGGIGLV